MTDLGIVVFVSENNTKILDALPPNKAVVCVIAVPVEIVDGSPAYSFKPGDTTVIAPPNMLKSHVTLVEHSVEVWAEAMRRHIDAARVQLASH